MTIFLINEAEKNYIMAHLSADVAALALKPMPAGLNRDYIVGQLSARQKARAKLPGWYQNPDLVFPPALSVEQASSAATAAYKASLVQGERLFDLTGGMGIDALAFAKRIGTVTYVEPVEVLTQQAAHNFLVLQTPTIEVVTADARHFLENTSQHADWVYLDPHRRSQQGEKLVRLTDYQPNVLELMPLLAQKADKLLLKLSPMIDLRMVIQQLAPDSLYVVAVQNEVKEVLAVKAFRETPTEPAIVAVNLLDHRTDTFGFTPSDEANANITFQTPQTYLYEPNAALLKAGAFRSVAARFGVYKLAPNTHLYTSQTLIADFPGRVFKIIDSCRPQAKDLRTRLPDQKANLSVRNFPQPVAALRKKLQLTDGGYTYIFATTLLHNEHRLLITEKV